MIRVNIHTRTKMYKVSAMIFLIYFFKKKIDKIDHRSKPER